MTESKKSEYARLEIREKSNGPHWDLNPRSQSLWADTVQPEL